MSQFTSGDAWPIAFYWDCLGSVKLITNFHRTDLVI